MYWEGNQGICFTASLNDCFLRIICVQRFNRGRRLLHNVHFWCSVYSRVAFIWGWRLIGHICIYCTHTHTHTEILPHPQVHTHRWALVDKAPPQQEELSSLGMKKHLEGEHWILRSSAHTHTHTTTYPPHTTHLSSCRKETHTLIDSHKYVQTHSHTVLQFIT